MDELSGLDWNGVKWSEMEWGELRSNAMEWDKMEYIINQPDRNDLQWKDSQRWNEGGTSWG